VLFRSADPFGVLRDLRGMGETNALVDRRKSPLPREVPARMSQLYVDRHADESGRITASFEVLTLTGWAPAAR